MAHEVVCFGAGDYVTVAISLYGILRCLVRLDGAHCARTLRYVQRLAGEPPKLTLEDLIQLPWRRKSATKNKRCGWKKRKSASRRSSTVASMPFTTRVREALPKAYGEFSRHAFDYKNLIEGIAVYIRAELEQTIPNREDSEIVLREALAKPDLLAEALNDAVVIGRNRGVT